jgi:large subunit ribosomal protein L24e
MKCSRCGAEIGKGSGTMYVFRTGDIRYFCSSRCFRNDIITKRRPNPKEFRKAKK